MCNGPRSGINGMLQPKGGFLVIQESRLNGERVEIMAKSLLVSLRTLLGDVKVTELG